MGLEGQWYLCTDTCNFLLFDLIFFLGRGGGFRGGRGGGGDHKPQGKKIKFE